MKENDLDECSSSGENSRVIFQNKRTSENVELSSNDCYAIKPGYPSYKHHRHNHMPPYARHNIVKLHRAREVQVIYIFTSIYCKYNVITLMAYIFN